MLRVIRLAGGSRLILSAMLALLLSLASTGLVFANETLIQISSDPYTNGTSQHKTQVEPDVYSFGSTAVATFQSGRFFNGGASNIGWQLPTMVALPGNMASCQVRQSMQHHLDHIPVSAIPRLPTIPGTESGSSHCWGLSIPRPGLLM